MTIAIESPRIHSSDPVTQLQELQSYLHRTAQQLQWAFDTLEGSVSSAPVQISSQAPAAAQSPQRVFAGIKNLIIKSADIVEAYSAQITKRLEGQYAAQSDFGAFQEQTAQTLEADSQKLQQLFSSQESLSQTVDGLYDRVISSDAYVKTGLLYRDGEGTPVYGLEIGQKNQVDGQEVFDRFARFTANRLSFFDSADVEVAYISDYKLCITNAEISGSLQLGGRFRIYSGNGLIFKWTGGESHDGGL